MKNILTILSVSLLFLLTSLQQAAASHIIGAEITYRHISGNTYNIQYKIYRDCRGIPLAGVDFRLRCADGSNAVTLNPTRSSITDISSICPKDSLPCSPQNTPAGKGIEEHLFEVQVNFNDSPYKAIKANCCRVMVSLESCCRAGAITNITPGNMYLESMLDLCQSGSKGNNSPEFSSKMPSSVCCNQPFAYNCGAKESDNDSLAYEQVVPLNAPNSAESYTGNFSNAIPMTPYCPPNPGVINCRALPNAKPPRGYYFDNLNGDMILTPIKCDETAVIVYKVSEWRRDSNAVWQLVGYAKREMTLFVQTCNNNNPPYFGGTNNYTVCAGDQLCFNIYSYDDAFLPMQTIPDTVQMYWDSGIAAARFMIADIRAREKTAHFCWQTRREDASSSPYRFTVTLNDNYCPTPGIASRSYFINVKPRAQSSLKYRYGFRGKLIFESVPVSVAGYDPANFRYKFTIRDSSNSGLPLYLDYKRLDSFTFSQAGRYIIEHEINNPPYNCPSIFMDTVTITPEHLLNLQELVSAKISVYPNPSGGIVQLGGPETDYSAFAMKLYAADGKLVSEPLVKGKTVDCSALAKGVYTFTLEKEGVRYSGSVILQ